jgi:DNA repair protein RadA
MCHQLCVTAQLPVEEGGFDGAALYIDTEEVFTPSRIVQIANRFPSIDPETVLDKVIVARAYTTQHQIALLNSAEEVIKEEGVKLIIIDSLTSHFRSEYLGRATLAARQQTLNAHMHRLIRYAKAFDAAAVVTNQVTSNPDQYSGFEPKPIGGNIVGHIAHTRIFIRKGRNLDRILRIVASPFLAEGEVPARLNEFGLVSEEDVPQPEEGVE